MKHIISISVEQEIIRKMNEKLRSPDFRNKSHLVEKAILEFLKGDNK